MFLYSSIRLLVEKTRQLRMLANVLGTRIFHHFISETTNQLMRKLTIMNIMLVVAQHKTKLLHYCSIVN